MMRACRGWGVGCERLAQDSISMMERGFPPPPHHSLSISHPHLLVIAGGVPCELQNLCAEVLEHGREVDGGTGADAGGVLVPLEVPADARDRELEAGLGGLGGGLAASLAAPRFSFARHVGGGVVELCLYFVV